MTSLPKAVAAALCALLLAFPAIAAKPHGAVDISPELRAQLASFDLSSSEPVDVIVELVGEPAARVAEPNRPARVNQIRTERGNLFSQLRRNGIQVSPKLEFDYVFNGFSVTIPQNKLAVLATIPGVIGIYENAVMVRQGDGDPVMNVSPELATSVSTIQAPAAWNAGYRGAGILVAIIDDGVEYSHPDLGGCIGAGCKVVGGFDFVDVDADPKPNFTGTARDYHGTHVAATAAGLKGVAPDANILAIRVIGTRPGGLPGISNLDTVMAGAEYAVRNGADVVNMSIGFQGIASSSANLYAKVVGNVVKAGVVWVNSNGNDGPTPYIPNMYGAAPEGIATGNADARGLPVPSTNVVATGETLMGGTWISIFPAALLDTQITVVDVGFGNMPAHYAGKDVAGKVVLASRGTSGAIGEDASFVNKGAQAIAHGAAALILFNNVAGDFSPAAPGLPTYTLSQANGLKVRANPTIIISSVPSGTFMNAGSSRGPTFDLQIKPDVTAPGTGIVAAVPFDASSTGYAALNGTSMAAPHVAGAAALIRQAYPSWTPERVKTALMNTATNLNDLSGLMHRTIEQGGGLLNLSRAVESRLAVSPSSVSFGLLVPPSLSATRSITVHANATYNVSIEMLRSYTGGASVIADAAAVFPGTNTLNLTASIGAAAPAGEYEGYINFVNTADANDRYRVAFLFAHALPASEVRLSTHFAQSTGANPGERVTVTFNAGRDLADWYLGSAATRFTANQGPTSAGEKSFSWNVRTSTGQTLGAGQWTVGVWYKLNATDANFTFASTGTTRLYVDKIAPLIGIEGALPALTNTREITVRGAVSDAGMFALGEVGGKVLVNGEPADLFPRVPAVVFAGNVELAFDKTITLAEGQNTVTIYAEDSAGNRSSQTYNLTTTLDSIAPLTAAATNPAANGAGWNNTAATLTITSTDGGSGVKSVQYSVDGAATTVEAATASVNFNADGQYAITYSATDVAGNVEAAKSHNVWIDQTAPTIAFTGNGTYTVDQAVTVNCAANDNLSGVAATNCSTALLAKQAWELALGATTVTGNATDAAGNSFSATATVTVNVTFDSLINLTNQLLNGEMTNSFTSNLEKARDSFARGNITAMNGQLSAFQNHVNAQAGKALAADYAAALVRLAEALKK
jgi:minor extracellular serine protease Vpr